MLARTPHARALAVLATLAVTACASGTPPRSQPYAPAVRVPSLTPTSRVVDAERIQRSAAQTAWDAIRMLVPGYQFQAMRAPSLSMLGPVSARSFDPSIRVLVDGHRVDIEALRGIPAREVLAIHLLNETEASMYFGPGGSGGAIVVQTSVMRPRR